MVAKVKKYTSGRLTFHFQTVCNSIITHVCAEGLIWVAAKGLLERRNVTMTEVTKDFFGAPGAVELDWHIAQWKKPIPDGLTSRCRRFSDSLFIDCNHPLIVLVAPYLYSALSKTWSKCYPFGIKKPAQRQYSSLVSCPRLWSLMAKFDGNVTPLSHILKCHTTRIVA